MALFSMVLDGHSGLVHPFPFRTRKLSKPTFCVVLHLCAGSTVSCPPYFTMGCEFCKKVSERKGVILESKYWIVFLRPDQSYLGRTVIVLKTHKSALSKLSSSEWTDLGVTLKAVENSITCMFGAAMFNLTCQMNDAFKKGKHNPHIHWHLRPRYEKDVEFAGINFTDPDFGHHYDRTRKDIISDLVFQKILLKIKKNIK